jgi:hypothetical protein
MYLLDIINKRFELKYLACCTTYAKNLSEGWGRNNCILVYTSMVLVSAGDMRKYDTAAEKEIQRRHHYC